MSKTTVTIIALVALLVGALGGYELHGGTSSLAGAASPTGTTNSTSQICSQVISAAASTTLISCYNGGNDRVVSSIEAYYNTGNDLTQTLTFATSTYPSGNAQGYPGFQFPIATSSNAYWVSTSTTYFTNLTPQSRLWPASTYFNGVAQFLDATATNVTFIVHYYNL